MPRPLPLALSLVALAAAVPIRAQSFRDEAAQAFRRGDFAAAASLYEKSVATALKSLKEEDLEIIERRAELGDAYRAAGRLDEAIKQLDYVWKRSRYDAETKRRWADQEGALAMAGAESLGRAYLAAARYPDALLIFNTGLSDAERAGRHDDALQFVALLAEAQFVSGQDAEAASLASRAFAMAEKLTEKPVLQSRALSQLSTLCLRHDRHDLARPMAQRALEIARGHHADTLIVADLQARLAAVLVATSAFPEAEDLLKQARKVILTRETAQSLRLVEIFLPEADIALKQGRPEDALRPAQNALELCRSRHFQLHPQTARALGKVADCHMAMKNPEKARPLYREALELFEKTVGGDDPLAVAIRTRLESLGGAAVNPAASSSRPAAGK